MNICVYGASSDRIEPCYVEAAYELGMCMVNHGFGMVFGGGARGLMGAAARGVFEKKGIIIGVAPQFFNVDGVLFQECTEFYYTDTMRARKQIMEDNAEAFIALPGGFGTFEEFFEILTAKQLQLHNKAIVLLNTNGFYTELIQFMDKSMKEGFVKEKCRQLYYVADTPEDAVLYIKNYRPKEFNNLKDRA